MNFSLKKVHDLVVASLEFLYIIGVLFMGKKTEEIKFRTTKKEKELIQERTEKFGFKSMTAFLISSAEDFFVIDLDLSFYRDVAKEINYIGNNINNLVHHIFAIGAYSDMT